MPKLDGTGPSGQGSKTGRVMGNCNGSNNSSVASFKHCGHRRGVGLGLRRASSNQN